MQPLSRTIIPDVRKIAVLRANALGDFLFTLPALDALRAAYPHAEITLLGRDWHRDFLANRPGPIDRVIPIPALWDSIQGFPAAVSAVVIEAVFAPLRQERFDLALQLHGGGRHSNPFTARLDARLTAGLRTTDAPPLTRWVPYLYYQSEIARYLEVVALVGAPAVTHEPQITVIDADLHESYAVVPETPAPLVVLHPGANDPRRRWSPAHFAAVGDALAALGAAIIVTGTANEAAIVADTVRAMRAPARDLCGALSLGGLTGLLARCRLVLSNDSGPLHLAGAVGTRTVGIYWCGNMITAGPLTVTRHRTAISWNLLCPVCGTNCIHASCNHRESFVTDVPIAAVQEAAEALWRDDSG